MRLWKLRLANRLRAAADRLYPIPVPPPFRLDISPDPDAPGAVVIEFRANSSGFISMEAKDGGGSVRALHAGDRWQMKGPTP